MQRISHDMGTRSPNMSCDGRRQQPVMAYTRAAAVTNTRLHNQSVQPAAALHQPPDSRQPCSQGGRSEQTLHNTAAESPVAHACAQFSATNARALHHAAQRIAQEQHLLRRAVAQHTRRRPLPQSHNKQGGVSIVSSPMLGMQTAHTAPILCICAAASPAQHAGMHMPGKRMQRSSNSNTVKQPQGATCVAAPVARAVCVYTNPIRR